MAELNLNLLAHLYWLFLLLGGVACLIHFFATGRPVRALHHAGTGVPEWRLRFLDFAVGVLLAGLIVVTGQLVAGQLLLAFGDPDEVLATNLAGGYAFHISALLAVVVLYRAYPGHFNSFSASPLPWPRAIRLGGYAFLASLPLVLLAAFFWREILEALQLPVDQQAVVKMFREIDTWTGLTGMIVLTVAIAPVSEEVIFRGCLYRFLKGKTTMLLAIPMSAALFALLHWNWLSVIPLFLLGVILAYAYERTGNLKVPILLHALFNGNQVLLLLMTRDLV